MSSNAESLNSLGNDLSDEGRWPEAEQAYIRATEIDPSWSAPWYNLGLLYKQQRRWHDSIRANQMAVDLDPSYRDAWWNLGIAATAIENWPLARAAWRGCGISFPDGDGPIQAELGLVPIRLNPQGNGEVVWSHRIDPARAIIGNVPLPSSGYCEGDVVLHDGAANGYRKLDGRTVPVFDVLQRLTPSPRRTYEAWIEAASSSAVVALTSMAESMNLQAEDWTESMYSLCKACSEGTPHEEHDSLESVAWVARRHVGISAEDAETAIDMLERWASAAPDRAVLEVKRPPN
jgi:hypothetical protein